MTRSRNAFTRLLTSLLFVCLWFVFQDGVRIAAAQDQPDKGDKPAATSESDATTPARSATDTPAATEDDPDKVKRAARYHEQREAELQHAVKEQTDAYLQLEKRDEAFQTYFFIAAGALGILLVGLFVFSRVRRK